MNIWAIIIGIIIGLLAGGVLFFWAFDSVLKAMGFTKNLWGGR